jgi:hypothetical protein
MSSTSVRSLETLEEQSRRLESLSFIATGEGQTLFEELRGPLQV